jgi:ubiquitin-conjugating enzyme E2 O
VLSREFILRALELRLGGLESELEWMYLSDGRLKKALNDSEALIERSKLDIEEDRNLAVSKLTAGGVILLQRTITKLKLLLTNYSVHT